MASTGEIAALHRVARRLKARAELRLARPLDRLPPLLLLTDPERTGNPVSAAEALPPGCGVIYRAFGRDDAVEVGRRLADVARRRGLVLLAGADAELARRIGACGVHLPERLAHRLPVLRARWPGGLLTLACHGRAAVRRAERLGADACLLSSVFASASPSAGRPLGRVRFGAIVRDAGVPVFALGGVDTKNAPELLGSGAAGVAAVSALTRT